MEIAVITNQNDWDSWLDQAENPPFQQSSDWGMVLAAEGRTVERLAVTDSGQPVLLAQVTYQKMPFGGQYAYAAAGPVGNKEHGTRNMEQAATVLCDYLKKKNCIFFRIEPQYMLRDTSYMLQKSFDLTPSTTSILDLRKPLEDLLASMHKNTRYSIRQAKSKGVTVKQEKHFEIFWTLMQKTGERNKLRLHNRKHYEIILQNKNCVQLVAYKENTPIATAVFWNFAGTMTYLFAASDYEHHDLAAPYLLQKEAITLAQKLGCKHYDFFGIAPRTKKQESNKTTNQNEYEYDRAHKYAGITKFKMGFGGSVVGRPGTYDVVLKKNLYRLYTLIRKVRRLI